MSTAIDLRTERRILDFIKTNLADLLASSGQYNKRNPGVTEYDLIGLAVRNPRIKYIDDISADEIRDYLQDLERKGELRVVEERGEGKNKLKLYLPMERHQQQS